jgi:hypothetical protein
MFATSPGFRFRGEYVSHRYFRAVRFGAHWVRKSENLLRL